MPPSSEVSSSTTTLEQKTNYPLVIKTFFSVITSIILAVLLIIILAQIYPLSITASDFSACTTNSDSKLRALKLNSYEIINIVLNCVTLLVSILISLYLILNVTDCCQCSCVGILKSQDKLKAAKANLTKNRKTSVKNKKQQNSVDTQWQQNGQQVQCDDIQGCIGYCCGCRCCKTCQDAVLFSFYGSKNKQLAYWIFYLFKTWILIILLLHIINNYSALNSLSSCMSSNAHNYTTQYIAVLIIACFGLFFDLIGYLFLCIQGTIFQPQTDQQNNPKIKAEYYLINLKVLQDDQRKGQNNENQKKKVLNQKNQKDLRQSQIQIYTTEEQNQFFSKMKKDHLYQNNKDKIYEQNKKQNFSHTNQFDRSKFNRNIQLQQRQGQKQSENSRVSNNLRAVKEIHERRQNQSRQPTSTFRQLIRQQDHHQINSKNKFSTFH